jgi:hypothetical protein
MAVRLAGITDKHDQRFEREEHLTDLLQKFEPDPLECISFLDAMLKEHERNDADVAHYAMKLRIALGTLDSRRPLTDGDLEDKAYADWRVKRDA